MIKVILYIIIVIEEKDKFIVIKNKTKDPVVSALPHPLYDYEKNVFTEDGREEYLKEQWIKKEKK